MNYNRAQMRLYAFLLSLFTAIPTTGGVTESTIAISIGECQISFYSLAQKMSAAKRGGEELDNVRDDSEIRSILESIISDARYAAIGLDRGMCDSRDFDFRFEHIRKYMLWENYRETSHLRIPQIGTDSSGNYTIEEGFKKDESKARIGSFLLPKTAEDSALAQLKLIIDSNGIQLLYEALQYFEKNKSSSRESVGNSVRKFIGKEHPLLSWSSGNVKGRYSSADFICDFNGLPIRRSHFALEETVELVLDLFLSRKFYEYSVNNQIDQSPRFMDACKSYTYRWAKGELFKSIRNSLPEPSDEELRAYYDLNSDVFALPRTIVAVRHEVATNDSQEASHVFFCVKNSNPIKESLRKSYKKTTQELTIDHPLFVSFLKSKATFPKRVDSGYVFYEKTDEIGRCIPPLEKVRDLVRTKMIEEQFVEKLASVGKEFFRCNPLELHPELYEIIKSEWFKNIPTGQY